MSRIRCNPESIQRMVALTILDTRDFLRCERELERQQPRVEREHVESRRQSVECWQPCVLSRNYRSSPSYDFGGVFDSKPFFQPPTIRPSSSTFSEIRANFLLSRACSSHETRKKNFRISIFFTAKRIIGSFSFLL